ncbi:MAG: hypothetical protein ACM336_00040 [Acidobacteriota bacterium]
MTALWTSRAPVAPAAPGTLFPAAGRLATWERAALVEVFRGTQAAQRAACEGAATAADTVVNGHASPADRRAAWETICAFCVAELGIDLSASSPIRATASVDKLGRIDPPDLYEVILRLLRSRCWRNARITRPGSYLRTAVHRTVRRHYLRALARLRHQDATHVDVTPEIADTVVSGASRSSSDLCDLPDALRASGARKDRELAATIDAWLDGATKAALGDAGYQRMMYQLRTPRLRAMAQRLGLDRVARVTERVIVRRRTASGGITTRKVAVVLTGAAPLLPFAQHRQQQRRAVAHDPEAERQELYRRVWGPLWPTICVPRGY